MGKQLQFFAAMDDLFMTEEQILNKDLKIAYHQLRAIETYLVGVTIDKEVKDLIARVQSAAFNDTMPNKDKEDILDECQLVFEYYYL